MLIAAGRRQESVLPKFRGRILTSYSGLMRTESPSFHTQIKFLQENAQSKAEYIGVYRICVDDDGHLLCIDRATSDEECGDSPSRQNNGDDHIIEVPVLPYNPPRNAT